MKRIQTHAPDYLVADVVSGLVPVALDEIRHRLGRRVTFLTTDESGTVAFHCRAHWQELLQLRTVTAIYACSRYPIPRPRALLGHQHFQRLLAQIEQVRRLHPPHAVCSFRVGAAGSDSAVFRRLKAAIAQRTGLVHDDQDGDLLLQVRLARYGKGWEVLCRLTPRPLSARSWRVENMPGALDATIAAAMVRLTIPAPGDRFLNLMCGSGTLLVERLALAPVKNVTGCDIDSDALRAAQRNLRAAGTAQHVELCQEDATQLPFAAGSFDVLVADLPWGQLVGSHAQNQGLYPQTLCEAARVAAPGARFVLITHEVRLLEGVLREQAHLWQLHDVIKLRRGNLHPRIYLLQRT